MSEIILYPTETVYALGVNVFDSTAWQALCDLKQRDDGQPASWLVRDQADIAQYAQVDDVATGLMERFMPGPITLVLPAKDSVPPWAQSAQGMVSFRISTDLTAQQLIADYMDTHDAPLTCTSANVHGLLPAATVPAIKDQFGQAASQLSRIIDDGARTATTSTVVAVKNDQLEILRAGSISLADLQSGL